MANEHSSNQVEWQSGAHHPAFYQPGSQAVIKLEAVGIQQPVQTEVKYGNQSDGWIILILMLVFVFSLMDWFWRNRH